MNKKKCLLNFLYQIKSIVVEKFFYLFYFIRKIKYWLNFGFFVPKIHNISYNNSLYKAMISLKEPIPEGLTYDPIRSRFGRTYFRFFFRFVYGLIHFSSYFMLFYRQIKKLMKIRIRSRHYTKTKSYNFLRFFTMKDYTNEVKEIQKIFNIYICKKITTKKVEITKFQPSV